MADAEGLTPQDLISFNVLAVIGALRHFIAGRALDLDLSARVLDGSALVC